MSWYDDYMTRITINGDSEQQIIENEWTENFDYYFSNGANKYPLDINNSGLIEYALIQDNSRSESVYDEKILLCKKDSSFEVGNYYNWKNFNWMLTESDVRVIDSHKKFFVAKANGLLNFLDKSGTIRSFPCTYKISSGTETDTKENKYIEVLDGEAIVRVQSNEFTQQLSRANDGVSQRFIFSRFECYELKNIYTSVQEGVIILKLQQSEINTNKDKQVEYDGELIWIADYEDRPVYSIDIDQSNSEINTSSTLQLTAQITKDGQMYVDEIEWLTSNEAIATINQDGLVTTLLLEGSVAITARLKDNTSVFDTVDITVTNTIVDDFSYSVIPDVSGIRLGQTVVFDVQGYNNGQEIVETYTIEIDGSTTADSSDYEFVVIDSDSFSVKNNNDGEIVSIKITPDSNAGASFVKNISLDYLW